MIFELYDFKARLINSRGAWKGVSLRKSQQDSEPWSRRHFRVPRLAAERLIDCAAGLSTLSPQALLSLALICL